MNTEHFRPVQFAFDEVSDTIRCPAGATLRPSGKHTRNRVIRYRTSACKTCRLKERCTPGAQRTIHRLFDQGALDRMQARIYADPSLTVTRRRTVEHPFGTIKRRNYPLNINRSVYPRNGCVHRPHPLTPPMETPALARLTLRLDFGPGRAIGHGKIRLLEAVRDYGSISAAGRSMGMSYRRAWLLIDELNGLFDEPVIETKHGGPGGGGAELTPFGHRVVQQYRSIETKAHIAVADDLDALAAAMAKSLPDR